MDRSSLRARRVGLLALAVSAAALYAPSAFADNAIQLENAKAVDPVKDDWQPDYDATYQAKNIGIDGVIDGYPSSWTLRNGDHLGLKVSTTAGSFRTRIYRIGWYGGVGSRLVYEVASTPGERQPFPAENDDTGLVECKWHDSVSLTIPADWITGHYAVRLTTDSGQEAYTYFVVRDDAAPTKAAIIYTDSLNTAQAYNPWPKTFDGAGKQVGGKSLYQYNSGGQPTKASGDVMAVAISFDRPEGENWGLGIWRDWTIPMVQWLEMRGYDVAYATSIDLDNGFVLGSRKMWMDAGHDEYITRGEWDNLVAARDEGLNLAFFSGNDFSWQVRYEDGSVGKSTMVGYKIAAYPDEGRCGSCWDWGGDPEFQAALKAKAAGDTAGQLAHLKMVTYSWSGLKDWDPNAPSPTYPGDRGAPEVAPKPIARAAINLEGLMNGAKLRSCSPGAPPSDVCNGVTWVVDNSSHWVYANTGLHDGDRLPLIVGYEMDNLRVDQTYTTRPTTQIQLAHTDSVFTPDKGSAVDFSGEFNAQYYQAKSGAHVFSAGTINWGWGLDRPGVGQWGGISLDTQVSNGSRLATVVSQITDNVLQKMLTGPGTPPSTTGPSDAGTGSDSGTDPGVDPGAVGNGGNGGDDAGTDPNANANASTGSGGGCAYGGEAEGSTFVLFGLAIAGVFVARRRASNGG